MFPARLAVKEGRFRPANVDWLRKRSHFGPFTLGCWRRNGLRAESSRHAGGLDVRSTPLRPGAKREAAAERDRPENPATASALRLMSLG